MHSVVEFGTTSRQLRRRSHGVARVAVSVCVIVIPSVWPGPPAVSQEVSAQLAPTVQAGASIFGRKGCVKCHSIDGLRVMMGLDSERPPQTWRFYHLAADMWNHMPVMANSMLELGIERPHLDPSEIADLVVFLFDRVNSLAPGDTAAGRVLFTEKQCITCHQVGGVGGIAGPNLDLTSEAHSPIRLAAAMWNHGPEMAESMQSKGIERRTLTGLELADLYAYFSAADPSQEVAGPVLPGSAGRGRGLYRSAGCRGCHGSDGRGGRGPSLARRDRDWDSTQFAAAMWNKAPAMMAEMRTGGTRAPRLTPAEMADIVAFLHSLRYFEGAGDPDLGREVIRDKGCLECHSLDGRGSGGEHELTSALGLDSPVAVIAALWNHVILLGDLPEEGGQPWPLFGEEEMANLAAFFVAQR